MTILFWILGFAIVYMLVRFLLAPIFFPSACCDSTYLIDFRQLRDEGYEGLIFDIDNTLVKHNEGATEEAIELLNGLKEMGFAVTFLSNNKEPRVKSFRDAALPCANYIYKAGKPLKKGYLAAVEKMNTSVEKTVFVGDQLFTDVWGAKRCNIYHILVKPINPKEEIQIVLKRKLEWIVLHYYQKDVKIKQKSH